MGFNWHPCQLHNEQCSEKDIDKSSFTTGLLDFSARTMNHSLWKQKRVKYCIFTFLLQDNHIFLLASVFT